MTDFNAQSADFQRREQELKAKEQEIRLRELELEIQRLEDPTTPAPAADYSPTRRHEEQPGFFERLSRKAKLAAKLITFAALGLTVVWLASFMFKLALVLAIGGIVYVLFVEKPFQK